LAAILPGGKQKALVALVINAIASNKGAGNGVFSEPQTTLIAGGANNKGVGSNNLKAFKDDRPTRRTPRAQRVTGPAILRLPTEPDPTMQRRSKGHGLIATNTKGAKGAVAAILEWLANTGAGSSQLKSFKSTSKQVHLPRVPKVQAAAIFSTEDAKEGCYGGKRPHHSASTYHPTTKAYHPSASTSHPSASTYHPSASTSHPPASTYHAPASASHPPAAAYHPPASASHPPASASHPKWWWKQRRRGAAAIRRTRRKSKGENG